MLISIIICTRNRSDDLKATLRSLDSIDTPPHSKVEVVVVDNGSNDGTPALLRSSTCWNRNIRTVSHPEKGKAGALNAGLAASHGDIIILTDDDVRPDRDWLKNVSSPLAREECDVVAGRVTIAPHLQRPWMSPTHATWLASTECMDPKNPETAVGANMAFNRRVLRHVPAFDIELGPGKLGLWEDTLFSMQLTKAGYKIRFEPTAIVEHAFDPKRLLRKAFLSRAKAEARSSAYVAWHWRHLAPRKSLARTCFYQCHLLAKRMLRRGWLKPEGAPDWELNLLTGIEFERHLKKERLRKQNYDKFGLIKLGAHNEVNACT